MDESRSHPGGQRSPEVTDAIALVFCWFVAEFIGLCIGGVVEIILYSNRNPSLLIGYIFGIVAAGCSAFVIFQVAKALPSTVIIEPSDSDYYRWWQDSRALHQGNQPPSPGNPGITDARPADAARIHDRIHG